MILTGLTLEELSKAIEDGDKVRAWRKTVVSRLTDIDDVFKALVQMKADYPGDTEVETEMNDLTSVLKTAMVNVSDKY